MNTILFSVSLDVSLENDRLREMRVEFTPDEKNSHSGGDDSQPPVIFIGCQGKNPQLMTDLDIIKHTLNVLPSLAEAGFVSLPVYVNFGSAVRAVIDENYQIRHMAGKARA